MNHICFNGKIMPADKPVLMANNRSYRYGDGLFETMKVTDKKICLEKYHFERLFSSLKILGYKVPPLLTAVKLREEILSLCTKSKCDALARVRLSVFRGNGGVYEGLDDLQYLVECWPLSESLQQLNENGLVIDVFMDARKSCDLFSNIKSANFLPYLMAAKFAKDNQLNECLVLNTQERIADATNANIFLIKNGSLVTPPLSEGGVNGVMRRYILEKIKTEEKEISIDDLLNAEDVFLSNAITGIRWVQRFRDKSYPGLQVKKIYTELVPTISV